MHPEIRIRETRAVDLEDGYLIDGFPSMGFSSAIATESMIRTSNFTPAGILDSDRFPPISLVKDGRPSHPARIFVNDEIKVSIFSSYLTLTEPLHRAAARAMLTWARKQKIKLVVSSVAVKSHDGGEGITAVGSTESARTRLAKAGLKSLGHGVIPGISGMLLNEGGVAGQDVIVILFQSAGTGPDYTLSAQLCMAMSRLIPGVACDVPSLQREAEKAEDVIKKTDEESRHLKDLMYG